MGSKKLVARAGMTVSPSTVRGELAELERFGLLTHPHTSAGPSPDRSGVSLLRASCSSGSSRARARSRSLSRPRAASSRRRSRRRPTTLSQATRLLALVSAPRLETATVRHIEVLVLQPQVADGRDDHVHRRSVEAALRAGRPCRHGPCALGGRVPERAACRARAREALRCAAGSTIRRCPLASARSSNCCALRSPS